MQFIAIGGAVGSGLFLGSATGIQMAGPAILVTYLACGLIIFLVARALGEMALERPVRGSFSTYAEDYIGGWAGFMCGWSYWLMWVLACCSDLTALGIFTRYWIPGVPLWAPGLIAFAVLAAVNVVTVRLFGEIEFWLSLTKVATILFLIASGLFVAYLSAGGAGARELVADGGFAPRGWAAAMVAFPIAIFAFGGVELIGLTAAEAEDVERSLPRAVNGVALRVLIFYVGSLAIVMMLLPWRSIGLDQSPFVLAFGRIGIPGAKSIVSLVVITASLSACNSAIFATGRVLAALAEHGHAPAGLGLIDKRGQPRRAILASVVIAASVAAFGWLTSGSFFNTLISATAILLLFTWAMIVAAHLGFRRQFGRGRFAMPFAPASNVLVLLVLFGVALMMMATPGSRPMMICALIWFALLAVCFRLTGHRRRSGTAALQ